MGERNYGNRAAPTAPVSTDPNRAPTGMDVLFGQYGSTQKPPTGGASVGGRGGFNNMAATPSSGRSASVYVTGTNDKYKGTAGQGRADNPGNRAADAAFLKNNKTDIRWNDQVNSGTPHPDIPSVGSPQRKAVDPMRTKEHRMVRMIARWNKDPSDFQGGRTILE